MVFGSLFKGSNTHQSSTSGSSYTGSGSSSSGSSGSSGSSYSDGTRTRSKTGKYQYKNRKSRYSDSRHSSQGKPVRSCPLRVSLRRSWSGCHVNMAKIDWPDFHTDGLVVVWRKDEELIALPIRNGRVGFGIHELQGQGASLLQQRGFTEKDTNTLKNLLESKFAGMCLKSRADKDKEFEQHWTQKSRGAGGNQGRHNNNPTATNISQRTTKEFNRQNNNINLSEQINSFITAKLAQAQQMHEGHSLSSLQRTDAASREANSHPFHPADQEDVSQRNQHRKDKRLSKRKNKRRSNTENNKQRHHREEKHSKVVQKPDFDEEIEEVESLTDTYQGVSSIGTPKVSAVAPRTSQTPVETTSTQRANSIKNIATQPATVPRTGAANVCNRKENSQQCLQPSEVDRTSGSTSEANTSESIPTDIYGKLVKENNCEANMEGYRERMLLEKRVYGPVYNYQTLPAHSNQGNLLISGVMYNNNCEVSHAHMHQSAVSHLPKEFGRVPLTISQRTAHTFCHSNMETRQHPDVTTGRMTPYTEYLLSHGVKPPDMWNDHMRHPNVSNFNIDKVYGESEQAGYPIGCMDRVGVNLSTTESTSSIANKAEDGVRTPGGRENCHLEKVDEHTFNRIQRTSMYNHSNQSCGNIDSDNIYNNYNNINRNSKNNNNNQHCKRNEIASVSKTCTTIFHVHKSSTRQTRKNAIKRICEQVGRKWQRFVIKHKASTNTNNNGNSMSRSRKWKRRLMVRFSNHQMNAGHSKLLSEDVGEELSTAGAPSNDVNKTPFHTEANAMPFLSHMIQQLSPTKETIQMNSSINDLDISDDSVLDDLYTGLPPNQFRKSTMSWSTKKVMADVPPGLKRSDYMYMSAAPMRSKQPRGKLPRKMPRPSPRVRVKRKSKSPRKRRVRFRRRASSPIRRRLRPVGGVTPEQTSAFFSSDSDSSTLYIDMAKAISSQSSPLRHSKANCKSTSQKSVGTEDKKTKKLVATDAARVPLFTTNNKLSTRNKVADGKLSVAVGNLNHNNNEGGSLSDVYDSSERSSKSVSYFDQHGNIIYNISDKRSLPPKPKKKDWLTLSIEQQLSQRQASSQQQESLSNTKIKPTKKKFSLSPTDLQKNSCFSQPTTSCTHKQWKDDFHSMALNRSMAELFHRVDNLKINSCDLPLDRPTESDRKEEDIFRYNIELTENGGLEARRNRTQGFASANNHNSVIRKHKPVLTSDGTKNLHISGHLRQSHRHLNINSNHQHHLIKASRKGNDCRSKNNNRRKSTTPTSTEYSGSTLASTSASSSSGLYTESTESTELKNQTADPKLLTREQVIHQLLRAPETSNRKGRRARLVFQANLDLRTICKRGRKHLVYQGKILCELHNHIEQALKKSGIKIMKNLESYLPLWKYVAKDKSLKLPPIVVLDNHNYINGYYLGDTI